MTREKNGHRRILWWNFINLSVILTLSIVLLNADFNAQAVFYVTVSVLFLFSGIFIKRAYVFIGILIFALVFIFIAKDLIISSASEEENSGFNFNFFINSNK